jgi:hypothetical protein
LEKKNRFWNPSFNKKKYVAHSLAHLAIKKKIKDQTKKYIKDQMIKKTIR